MIVEAPKLKIRELTENTKGECSKGIRERVLRARKRQCMRYEGTAYHFNSELDVGGVHRFCQLGEEQQQFITQMYENLELSARGYHRLLKLARTIADLDDCEKITVDHLSEAVCYRMTDMWNA